LLGGHTSLIATGANAAIALNNTVDGINVYQLVLNASGVGGTVAVNGLIGNAITNTNKVTTLTVTGIATLNADIYTTSNQTYNSAVKLGGNRILDSNAGTIQFVEYH
jgi:hypothetical protein